MAYIPGFKHDIFISYAHVDNAKFFQERRMGWVETDFCKYLEVLLSQKVGRNSSDKQRGLNIWWDGKDLDPGHQFDDKIEKGVQECSDLS